MTRRSSRRGQPAKMPNLNLEISEELAAQLQGYDAGKLLQMGLHEAQMRAQTRRQEAGGISIARAAAEAGVGLRQMIGYATMHGLRPDFDDVAGTDEQRGWYALSTQHSAPGTQRSAPSLALVCGAESLIALAQIERLDLLLQLGGGVLHISDGVWREVVLRGVDEDTISAKLLHTLVHARKLRHHPVKIAAADPQLALIEEETLALAVQMPADIALLDDPIGRQAARDLGLKVRGSVSVLIESARRGYITSEQAQTLAYRMATRATWIDTDFVEKLKAELWKSSSNIVPYCSRLPTA